MDCVIPNSIGTELSIVISTLVSAVKKTANALKRLPKREQDRQWLLIYNVWSESDLRGNGQAFLADLKKVRFQFMKDV